MIAATNLPESLDRALWRRFDHVVPFAAPDLEARASFLTHRLAGVPCAPAVAAALAARTGHRTLADLERVVSRACVRRVLDGEPVLTLDALGNELHTLHASPLAVEGVSQ